MIEEMLEGGIYIAKRLRGMQWEPSIKEVPHLDQETKVIYELNGITVDTDLSGVRIPVFEGMHPVFDFTRRCETVEDLLEIRLQKKFMIAIRKE